MSATSGSAVGQKTADVRGWHQGSAYRYNQGCRCDWCREAKQAARNRTRARARAENRPSYQRELATAKLLKRSYRGTCERCGGPTDGSNGRAKAPKVCLTCTNELREPAHGTTSRYTSTKHRCRCEKCRAGWATYMREYKRRRRARLRASQSALSAERATKDGSESSRGVSG